MSGVEILRMANHIAKRFRHIWGYEYEDLIQEAALAIWRARHGSMAYRWRAAANALRTLISKTMRRHEFPTFPLPDRAIERDPLESLLHKERMEFLVEVGLV